jgi:D-sedoheptulose 7-phosphate isomerase
LDNFNEYLSTQNLVLEQSKKLSTNISEIISHVSLKMKNGATAYFCGNGGSAAEAQHLAAEFMGRFNIDRAPQSAVALSVDTSALTAIANDYGFDNVFARQVQGLCKENDVLFVLTTSGNSENLIKAVQEANKKNVLTVGFIGGAGGRLKGLCDFELIVPSDKTYFIQEVHLMIGHYICYRIEKILSEQNK